MIDVTLLAVLIAVVSAYYIALFVLSHFRRPVAVGASLPHFVVVIPAHNEELVIAATIERLLASTYGDFEILVMDDGSTDRTSEICETYGDRGVSLVRRPPTIAGRGKGAVLNHAFALLRSRSSETRSAREIVIVVVDADGQLDATALELVAPYFSDPNVGGVQIGVRIANARDGLLERAQDMEFVGFSGFVQTARDWTGSVGLGGNGQFTRLTALESLGTEPWTSCLTEDLDLGLMLVERGWRIRFCPDAFVAQQGLDRIRPLLRQRTRWVQGHYQCWKHFRRLASARNVSLLCRLDLMLYLGLLVLVTGFAANAVIGFLQILGVVEVHNGLLEVFGSGAGQRLVTVVLSAGPPGAFIWTYQRRALHPLRWWQVPAATAYFTAYTYLFVLCQFRAWYRIVTGRNNWAKTGRVATGSSLNIPSQFELTSAPPTNPVDLVEAG